MNGFDSNNMNEISLAKKKFIELASSIDPVKSKDDLIKEMITDNIDAIKVLIDKNIPRVKIVKLFNENFPMYKYKLTVSELSSFLNGGKKRKVKKLKDSD